MKARIQREIAPLIYRGSTELGRATGYTDKRIHERWRRAGLEYLVSDNGTFLYDPKKVLKFLEKYYAPPQMKSSLLSSKQNNHVNL